MPRAPRLEFAGAIYHVWNRGNYRQNLFTTHRTGAAFERALFEACARFGWRLHAYVVMRNHYHLCVETPKPNLVAGMQWLQSVFANRFNRFQKMPGHVFQGRYKALVVEPGPWLLRVVNYIHLNPVRAGLVSVQGLRQHAASSFPRWFKRGRPAALTAERWLAQAGGLRPTPAGFRRYHQSLALAVEGNPRQRDELYRELCRGWHIGTVEAKQARLRSLLERPGKGAVALSLDDETTAAVILGKGLRLLGYKPADLAQSPKGAEWKVALGWWLRGQTGINNRWLGEHLHLGHRCSVSRLLHQPPTKTFQALTRTLMSPRNA